MNRFRTTAIVALLSLGALWSSSCRPAEWGKASIWGHKYNLSFKMPKSFKQSDEWFELKGRRLMEHGYKADGNAEYKFQIRALEMPIGAWHDMGFNRHAILTLGLTRDSPNPSDKIFDRQDFADPMWPVDVGPAEEFTTESADGKSIKYSRIIVYTGREKYVCYVLLTAVGPKGKPRSPDVDTFFDSLKIETEDDNNYIPETQDQ